MKHAGMIVALLVLLLLGAGALFFAPRQMTLTSNRQELMTRFMNQDYICCDLSAARGTPRCQEVLQGVGELARGAPGSDLSRAAANALARCPAAELMGFAGDPAVVRQPIGFLATKLQGQDKAAAEKAARLLVSDSTIARESAQNVRRGVGPLCWGVGTMSAPASDGSRPQCPHGPELVNAVAALLLDEREPEADREKAAAMLTELGDAASPAVPALARALESRKPAIRGAAAATLGALGQTGKDAVAALVGVAHREPAPGLREQMLRNLARLDTEAGCCYALFREPSPQCAETLATIARRPAEDCPAALVLEIARNPRAIAYPMPHLATALRAPDIGTRRRAADAVALIAGTLQWHSRVDREVVEALRDAFRSGIQGLALDAAEALRQIEDSAPVEGSLAAPEVFLVTLEDERSDRRAAAAWALGQAGRPAVIAVPALRKTLDESDEVLADAAYGAMNRIAMACGLDRLGYKRNGKYELRPEVMAALLNLSRPQKAAVTN